MKRVDRCVKHACQARELMRLIPANNADVEAYPKLAEQTITV